MVKPSSRLLEWADMELGLFFHFDIEVFDPEEWVRHWGSHYIIPAEKFNPYMLDTDQWIQTAAKAGAKYALLTAKHGTGFCLWPTKTYDYCVRNSKYRNGNGDIVGDFVSSCRKFGIKPGLYYNTLHNEYLKVRNGFVISGDKREQADYNRIVLSHLEELLSWYGDIFEIWFDGGIIMIEKGGPEIASLLQRLSPDIIAFEGPPGHPNLLRWAGSEHAVSKVDCWSTSNLFIAGENIIRCNPEGDADGTVWSPVEAPMPLRDIDRAFCGGWMWHEGEEHYTYDAEYLYERYCTTVGRNSNLLIGALPDNRGLIPDSDVNVFVNLGKLLNKHFGNPLAESSGKGYELIVKLPQICDVEAVVIMENQEEGQKIRKWVLEAAWPEKWGEGWFEVSKGCSIGHKRILNIGKLRIKKLRLRVVESRGEPIIRSFCVYGKTA